MKTLLNQLIRSIRGKLFAIMVAYILGIHNFYTGDNKTPDNASITIELNEVQENDSQKD